MIFIHTPGKFQVMDRRSETFLISQPKVRNLFKVIYKEFQKLENDNVAPCEESTGYNFDGCVMNEIEKVTL